MFEKALHYILIQNNWYIAMPPKTQNTWKNENVYKKKPLREHILTPPDNYFDPILPVFSTPHCDSACH